MSTSNGAGPWRCLVVGCEGLEEKRPIAPTAIDLARASGAKLALTHVVRAPPRTFRALGSPPAKQIHSDLVDTRRALLTELSDSIEASGIETDAKLRIGHPHMELIREGTERDADMIVVQERRQKSNGELGFAAVTTKLLRKSPLPVLALRTPRIDSPNRVAVALDVEADLDENELGQFNSALLKQGSALARFLGGSLDVIHVWSVWCEQQMRNRGQRTGEEIEQIRTRVEADRRTRLEVAIAAAGLSAEETRMHLIRGDAGRAIPAFVQQRQTGILVMGTLARTGVASILIGNTAEQLINRLPCSVLAMKPPGFVSPVLR
ncbi:MAG: universal stress protein [Myxococcota bacterium]